MQAPAQRELRGLKNVVSGKTDGEDIVLKIQELTSEHISFVLDGVDLAVANALRRAVISDIPTLGKCIYMKRRSLFRGLQQL